MLRSNSMVKMDWLNDILQMQRENHHDLDQEPSRMLADIQLLDDILDIVSEGLILQCEKSSEK